jgi:glycosyltransferase involved in cell wall biosynthesis
MDILHYSLGLPPFRRGGMTKYCDDLMISEGRLGNSVSLIYPGVLRDRSCRCSIKSRKVVTLSDVTLVGLFEIVNPLPVSLVDGIRDVELFEITKDRRTFDGFFEKHHFDVLHLHTLMGLPFELVEAAKVHGVRVIYTSHDYFAICPRVFLFHDGKSCNDDHNCRDCYRCNRNALSYDKMRFLQSPLYKTIKENKLIKNLRERHNNKVYDSDNTMNAASAINYDDIDNKNAELYLRWRKRNLDMLNAIDCMHFNSHRTLQTYKKYGKDAANCRVISISHASIKDLKKKVSVKDDLQIGYLGPAVTHKGFDLLIGVCDQLWNAGIKSFHLHTYINGIIEKPYLTNHGPYNYSGISEVMNEINLLVVPSVWGETYGFTALEAHSFGVPAIVSNMVGAQDLIRDGINGNIFNADKKSLYDLLSKLISDPHIVEKYSEWICANEVIKTMDMHAKEMIELYTLAGAERK